MHVQIGLPEHVQVCPAVPLAGAAVYYTAERRAHEPPEDAAASSLLPTKTMRVCVYIALSPLLIQSL